MICIVCRHAAQTMDVDPSHILHAFWYEESTHKITYPADPNDGRPYFYLCVRCADDLRKILAPEWKAPPDLRVRRWPENL